MRILVASPYFDSRVGGLEKFSRRLAAEYSRRGHEVRWLAMEDGLPSPEPGVRKLELPAYAFLDRWLDLPVPLPAGGAPAVVDRAVAAADVVHLQDTLCPTSWLVFAAAERRGVPVVITQHVGNIPYGNPLARLALRLVLATRTRPLLRRAAAVAYCSEVVARELATDRGRVIVNGLDTTVFRPGEPDERARVRRTLGVANDDPLLLFVGRFTEKKGLRLLHDAAKRLGARARWLFVGEGAERPEAWNLPTVTTEKPLSWERLAPIYRAADLLVLPSVGEGFPLVVQEALASGTAALVTEETVRALPAVRPYVFACEPRPDSILGTLGRALEDRKAREAMAAAGAAYAREHWSWTRCASRYLELLSEVAGTASVQAAR